MKSDKYKSKKHLLFEINELLIHNRTKFSDIMNLNGLNGKLLLLFEINEILIHNYILFNFHYKRGDYHEYKIFRYHKS